MIRTSAPFASWILQRQLTEMKEAAVGRREGDGLLRIFKSLARVHRLRGRLARDRRV